MKLKNTLKLIIFCILLILFQVLVLNQIEISTFVYPQIYFLGFLLFPVNSKHWFIILTSFISGLIMDMFTNTPGVHTFTLTLITYLRYLYFDKFYDKEKIGLNTMPTLGAVDSSWYIIYISAFSFLFHIVLFILTYFSFSHRLDIFQSTIFSTSLSILLILMVQFLFNPKQEANE